MAGSKPGSRGSKASSRQSARSVPPPINTDLDRKGRTPEESAERQKLRALGPAHAPAADPGLAPHGNSSKVGAQTAAAGKTARTPDPPAKPGAGQGTAQSTEELWEFLTAFQHAIEHLLHDKIVRSPSAENDRPDSAPDNHERATQLLFRVFKALATSDGESRDDKHANSMDLEEFLVPFLCDALACLCRSHSRVAMCSHNESASCACPGPSLFLKRRGAMQGACEALCISPGPLLKKDAISTFKLVNTSSGVSDYDQHELNKFEFVKCIDLIAKRIGISSIDELCFAQTGQNTNLAAERERRAKQAQRAADSILSQVRDLGDLNIKMMKEILKIFNARSDDNKADPELDIDQFVDVFAPILHLSEREVQLLFMKIDVNSDGAVSWNEFSTFVLNLNAKVTAQMPFIVYQRISYRTI